MNSKLREALEKILAIAKDEFEDIYNAGRIEDLCRQALAEPPRNSDVGTPSERTNRYVAFCNSHARCADCPCDKIAGDCEFSWGDMPYSEGDNNANK